MDERWISTEDASKISGYALEYIRTLARQQKIKSVKIGHAVLIDKKSLEEYTKMMEKN